MHKRVVIGFVAIVVLLAYLAGHVPEREQHVAAAAEAHALREKLTVAQARVRTGELLGQVITLGEVAQRRDFGQALDLSSAFFDAVRTEAATSPDPGLRQNLNAILSNRDAVTAGLARGEQTVCEILHGIELQLRGTLGYATPPQPASGSDGQDTAAGDDRAPADAAQPD
jgi:hypothetical protein